MGTQESNESMEMYLETIFMLSQNGAKIRSIDIANKMKFSKPSVSVAMKKLREQGLVLVNCDGIITLAEGGRRIAEEMYERHTILSNWLISLGVDAETATEDACRIEHVISKETFAAIKGITT